MGPIRLTVIPTGTQTAGTSPLPDAGTKVPGRFTVVQADGTSALYVPEVQQLYKLPPDLADSFRVVARDVSSPEYDDARKIVLSLLGPPAERPALQNRDRNPMLQDLVVHPSQVCNLDCKYCYAHEINKANQTMTPEVADRVVERAMTLAGPKGLSSIKFLGGEPTVAWDIVERLVLGFGRAHRAAGVRGPAYVIVTNGTLVTPRMIEFAAGHQMYVLVSLDGRQEIHDTLRPTRGGAGSYEKAAATLRALIAAGVDTAVEAVFTRQHVEQGITPQAMVDHFRSFGIREMHITVPVGTWHQIDTIQQMDTVASSFEQAARASVRSFRTGDPWVLRGITAVLDGFLLQEERDYVCGAGRSFMAVNYDGEAFPCYLLESAGTSYGFVDDRWSETRYAEVGRQFRRNGKTFHEVCRGCWANELCQSCLGYTFTIEEKVAKPPAWFCRFNKSIIAAVLGEVAAARDSSDWPTFVTNMKQSLLDPARPFVPVAREHRPH
ncbi:MAG: radical SAM protein [Vicinamibacterales bacterium]